MKQNHILYENKAKKFQKGEKKTKNKKLVICWLYLYNDI